MLLERTLVLLYLAGCIGIGVYASRRVLGSRDEYWVAGRRIGTGINAVAIMAKAPNDFQAAIDWGKG